ncbi:hypothetical protein ACOSP7_015003 [Xanthoceras sorbifolium]
MKKREMLAIEEGSKTCFTNTTKKKSEPKQDTSYLSKDIVRLIMEKLPWKDKSKDTEEFLPWGLRFYWDNQNSDGGGTCKLFDLSTETCYTVEKPTYGTERELVGAVICASRCGWVLFSKLIFVYNHSSHYRNKIFFLYSPFTNEIIEFPLLERDQSQEATFSSNPDSPDCTVIALSTRGINLCIKTCPLGGKSWNTFEFNNVTYKHSLCRLLNSTFILDMVYAGGFFYLLFKNGKLGAFNIKQQEWKWLTVQYPVTVRTMSHDSYTNGFHTNGLSVAFNGDVILRSQDFWRFELSEKKWVAVGDEIIEIQVIFLGFPGFGACAISFSVIQPHFSNPLRVSHLLQSSSKPYHIDKHVLLGK